MDSSNYLLSHYDLNRSGQEIRKSFQSMTIVMTCEMYIVPLLQGKIRIGTKDKG